MEKRAKQNKTHTTPDQQAEKAPRYKGIRLRNWGKWVSEVRIPKSRAKIWLGSYDTPQQAARAYDAAVFCLRGPKATLNFPDCIPVIACASSLSRKQIQVAAAKYAHDQIPSHPNPNPNSNCSNSDSVLNLTEKEPPSPSMSSSVSQTEPSSDSLPMWEEQEPNLWEAFMLDSAFMDLEKLPSLDTSEKGCIFFNTTDLWSWS